MSPFDATSNSAVAGVGASEGDPDQHEGQCVLAIMRDVGMRAVGRRSQRGEGDGGGEQPGEKPQKSGHDDRHNTICRSGALLLVHNMRVVNAPHDPKNL